MNGSRFRPQGALWLPTLLCALLLLLLALPGCGGGGDGARDLGSAEGFLFAPVTPGGAFVLANSETVGRGPIANASVTLVDGAVSAHTDLHGRFRLDNLPPGLRRLRVEPPGAAAFEVPVTVIAGAILSLGPPNITRDQAIALVRAELTGRDRLTGSEILAPQQPLPAGVRIGPALTDEQDTALPRTLDRLSWLVYVDLSPGDRWEHAVRYYYVDAANGALSSEVQLSFVSINGRTYYGDAAVNATSPDLVQARSRARAVATASTAPTAGDDVAAARRAIALLDDQPCVDRAAAPGASRAVTHDGVTHDGVTRDHVTCNDPHTYVLLIQGDVEENMAADTQTMRALLTPERFTGQGAGIVWSYVPPSSGYVDGKALIKQQYAAICAVARPCDTVFLYATAHGSEHGSVIVNNGPLVDGEPTGATQTGVLLPESDFDLSLCKACHIVMMFDTCFSGRIINRTRNFWTRNSNRITGKKLFVLSGSDDIEKSFSSDPVPLLVRGGGYFTNAFSDAMIAAAGGGSTVPLSSLPTVFQTAATATTAKASNRSTSFDDPNRPTIQGQHPKLWVRPLATGETCGGGTVTPSPSPSPTPGTTENHPPRITRVSNTFQSSTHSNYFVVTADDPDGDTLTYTWSWSGPATSCGTDNGPGSDGAKSHSYGHNGCAGAAEQSTRVTVTVRDSRGGEAHYELGLRQEGTFTP